ncbi:hypothetical protein MM1S1540310_1643 [Mycobacteroides abscessus subsp. bolletii 1S-154-0310]|uniref:Uncharacterized protein n=2 Tax=Mycobacteroides abscessus TaxID=36809 RepID=A0A829MHL5_9MYCO|nr:hypothetical protein MASS_2136 [Mycobacteroides abscessus subsp. bolletii 50594]AIC72288.1 hypothetical protein MYCMA_09515 [Mycobacteroides abscessus subsp. massiliense str. GO 06]EIU61760.1 hypothetical protein MM1S1510930_2088 [Mycobacteroides abscessus subsp. bolletii 1S-151-0930]EIU68227.1 hypothetical protein MM1S1520914_2294 [Mycobacteroides abscessus subsp. bolletii 1S-152-0914]EIU76715.1 hypothetical protein MM1S1530915_1636 [Mycobacteroides abscessus subsp. bolletii 1S-153-0915]EI
MHRPRRKIRAVASPMPLAAPVISTADPVIGLPDTLIGARD